MTVVVPAHEAEAGRARFLDLFPEGFEERTAGRGLELAAYTDSDGERRVRAAFGDGVRAGLVGADWAERWREFHRPVTLGRLWIGPPWRAPEPGLVPVVIDPGRAFGTGAHATTRLCLELLSELPRGSLLDVGCGSGVLGIAAAKLGFAPVVAVDSDPNALDAASRNAVVNGVTLAVVAADALVDPLPAAEVAVANIAHGAVRRLLPRLDARLIVASGYRADDPAPGAPGLVRERRREQDGWAADLFGRAAAGG